MTTVVVETLIEARIEICFDLARSLKIHQQSTISTQETVISRHEHDLLNFGDEVTFEAVHFLGSAKVDCTRSRISTP